VSEKNRFDIGNITKLTEIPNHVADQLGKWASLASHKTAEKASRTTQSVANLGMEATRTAFSVLPKLMENWPKKNIDDVELGDRPTKN
jgi:hypothetical protein